MFYFEVKYDLFCKAQQVVAVHIGEALLHSRSGFGVGNGGWHAWEEQAGLSPYQAAWQLERSCRVWPLRREMVPCPETELAPGVTVFLLLSLQNPIWTFGGSNRPGL